MKVRRYAEHERRRVEDRFRDEHHDAHAKTITPDNHRRQPDVATSTIAAGDNPSDVQQYSNLHRERRGHMLIRIVKHFPAPIMDGFDVSRLRVEQTYDVERRFGNYLIIAGYAVEVAADSAPATSSTA
jgi:hypothetical protein